MKVSTTNYLNIEGSNHQILFAGHMYESEWETVMSVCFHHPNFSKLADMDTFSKSDPFAVIFLQASFISFSCRQDWKLYIFSKLCKKLPVWSKVWRWTFLQVKLNHKINSFIVFSGNNDFIQQCLLIIITLSQLGRCPVKIVLS